MKDEAPERIWAVMGLDGIISFNDYDNGEQAYIRADLAPSPPADVAEAVKMLTEHDREYNRKTNALIARHAEQVETLSARVAELEKACAEWADVSQGNYQRAKDAEAALAGARDAAGSALARLDASLFTNAEHQQAKDILRAMK